MQTWNCRACGRDKSQEQFAPGALICALCATLPPRDLVETTRATMDRLYLGLRESKSKRKADRVQAKLEKYAREGKRCSACHGRKPAAAFNRCARMGDALQPICRECNALRVKLLGNGSGLAVWHQVRDAMRLQNDAARK